MLKRILCLAVALLCVVSLALAEPPPEYREVKELTERNTIAQANPNLSKSAPSKIVYEGQDGIVLVKYKITYDGGIELYRQIVSTTVLHEAQPRIIEYGTGENAPFATPIVSSTPVPGGKKSSKGVAARLNQKMATRSGPSTKYNSTGTYPKDTEIVVLRQEMGSGVAWGLVEFEYKGSMYRLYTGMKRIDCDKSKVEWENEENYVSHINTECKVHFGPGNEYATRKDHLQVGFEVQVIGYEKGYTIIDFYNLDHWVRGYVKEEYVN